MFKFSTTLYKLAAFIRKATDLVPEVGDEITFSKAGIPFRAIVTAPASFRRGLEIKYLAPPEKQGKVDYLDIIPENLKIIHSSAQKGVAAPHEFFRFYAQGPLLSAAGSGNEWEILVSKFGINELKTALKNDEIDDQDTLNDMIDEFQNNGDVVVLENEDASYIAYATNYQQGLNLVKDHIKTYSGIITNILKQY